MTKITPENARNTYVFIELQKYCKKWKNVNCDRVSHYSWPLNAIKWFCSQHTCLELNICYKVRWILEMQLYLMKNDECFFPKVFNISRQFCVLWKLKHWKLSNYELTISYSYSRLYKKSWLLVLQKFSLKV